MPASNDRGSYVVGARGSVALVAMVAATAFGGCGSESSPGGGASALGDDAITVASFDFPESELLAEVYGQALQAGGFEVHFEIGLGPRELVQPALARGLIELVPEYAGTALRFVSLGESRPTDDLVATTSALGHALRDRGLVALAPAPAQDANAVVVTRALADRHALEEISDLEAVAPHLTFGGPPGCPERPFCLAGLEDTYGVRFAAFLPLDVGGPLTHQALSGGHVDVALLFTTDPLIAGDELVVLADDRGLQPAENVTPVVRREVVDRWGDPLVDAVDEVSGRLTTETLRSLNARVADGEPGARVAGDWLRGEGLA
ncbi:MAG TPA: ABC transporter substrate-binding protein [Acidimicrobiales bacterium]